MEKDGGEEAKPVWLEEMEEAAKMAKKRARMEILCQSPTRHFAQKGTMMMMMMIMGDTQVEGKDKHLLHLRNNFHFLPPLLLFCSLVKVKRF